MKTQTNKKIISLTLMALLSPLTTLASPVVFPYLESNYLVTRLGNSLQVVPQVITTSLQPKSSSGWGYSLGGSSALEVACKKIEDSIEKVAWSIEACESEPGHAICEIAHQQLKMLGEGRTDNVSPISQDAIQAWNVRIQTPYVSKSNLRSAVATNYGVSSDRVEIKLDEEPRFVGEIRAEFASDSLSKRVAPVYKVSEMGLAEISKNGVVTKNKILACDLLSKKAVLRGQAKTDLSRLEKVSDQVVETSWKAYQGLKKFGELTQEDSPLVQSAVIGYRLAYVLPPKSVDVKDPLVGPAALFKTLYEVHDGQPVLKEFSSIHNLRSLAYPDKLFNVAVDQMWRMQ